MTIVDKNLFIEHYGGIYEDSPWVAELAWDRLCEPGEVQSIGNVLAQCVDDADDETKLALIRAHPDLAGRAAIRGELTQESTGEQASAGIDKCSPEEFERFQEYNDQYHRKFGFPFVMAVRDSNRQQILATFAERLQNDADIEFARAIAEIHKIARLRLAALEQESDG
ncbi:MAG: 2-oxo-4-hydroxy-4-carboxy-5-ureidoimidazoline decarboxylase [Woeseia sp.]|nr:2-oxo-4-hydroxy-4-carboxy-5-ureidoimidazoline decarboxylase [Woeseia sp.]MBT8096453.1 2-oxo-4-hydroxy-4-carboxy-5-ureidoimidazoline decarboxylase [Woeseia sp.]NNE62210.1 2-oxo-4-hydroxy-4-carboxy-5-ureidoimidazoline decarboxylase [Woeseia sp.]NNL55300.1 2-oxo-4-hydroxy-4-carboxy-5-ureidoimidazoline decarboxylase [Woeseia sp.]